MAKIELELNDAILERVQLMAASRHSTLNQLISDVLEEQTSEAIPSVVGLFADEPELMDDVLENAMQARENQPLRLPL